MNLAYDLKRRTFTYQTFKRVLSLLACVGTLALGCTDAGPDVPGGTGTGAGGAGATGGMAGTGGTGTGGTGTGGTGTGGTGAGGWGGGGGYPNLWVSVYYPGWTSNTLPVDKIDFSALTHLVHFSLAPTVTGGLDESKHNVGAAEAQTVINAAHNAGKKVLISVGGQGLGDAFASAVSDPYRATFVSTLVEHARSRGYDGIDIDMEPIKNPALFQTFSRDLRAEVNAKAPGLLLTTVGTGANSGSFGPIADVYDQVNIMTYDMVYGVGNTTWHNSALSGGSGQYYSVDRAASEYSSAGVPAAKIGVGIECSGYSWSGTTGPKQPTQNQPQGMAYTEIMAVFLQSAYVWDAEAWAPYLSLPTQFITYDDPLLASEKVHFVGKQGYGGLIVWDPSLAYFPAEVPGNQHPLLQAVKEAAFGL